MKKIKRIIIFCLTVVFLMPPIIKGQTTDCSSNYEKALLLYNKGMSDSALRVLQPCLESKRTLKSLSARTNGRIFRLAALSCIMTDNPRDAEKYVKQMLKYQPDYKDNFREDDLVEFRLMVNKRYSQPALRIGVMGGINIPFVKLEKKYSDYETSFGGDYTLDRSTGFQFGIAGEKTLTKNMSIEVAAGITQILFKYTVNGLQSVHYQYDQSISYIEIPVIARYYFSMKSSLKPYLEGGLEGRISLNEMEKSDVYGKYWFTNSSNSDKVLTTFLTDIQQVGLILGGGIGYDLKKFNLRLDFRYNHYFKSSGQASKFDNITGYDDISDDEKFHYTDDINLISMKNVQISVGLFYNLNYKVF